MIAVKIIRYSTIVLSLLTNCMLIRQFRCPQLSKLLKVRLPFLFFDGPGGGRDFTPMTGRVCVSVCDDLMVQPWWVGCDECRHRNWWVSDHSRLFLPLKRSSTKHSLYFHHYFSWGFESGELSIWSCTAKTDQETIVATSLNVVFVQWGDRRPKLKLFRSKTVIHVSQFTAKLKKYNSFVYS